MREGNIYRKRRKSYDTPGEAHELTFSCYQGRPFLSKPRTCQFLADAIVKAKVRYAFNVWAYVFMPEHAHVLVWPTEERYSMSKALKSVKQSVARRAVLYLRKHNPDGLRWLATGQKHDPYHFWQEGGGYDRNAKFPRSLAKMVEYIHNNPVRRGLVRDSADWKWSSARAWDGEGEGPVPVDFDSFPVVQ